MLNYFPLIIKAEKIHSDVLFIPWPGLMGMKGYQVALRNCSYKFNFLVGIVSSHFLEIIDKGLPAIPYYGIVLYVLETTYISTAFDGLPR